MRRLIRMAAGLYPRSWRERYGVEFHALLDDVHAGWREFFNVLGGAVKMQLLRSRSVWIFAISCGAAGALVAMALSFHGRQYVSTASVKVVAPAGGDVPAAVGSDVEIDRMRAMFLSHSNLIGLILDPAFRLYPDMRRSGRGLDEVAARMSQDVHIERSGDAMTISFAYPDREKTRMVTRRLAQQFAFRTEQEARGRTLEWKRFRPDTERPPTVQLVDVGPANVPDRVVWPTPLFYALAGLAMGLLAGFVAAGVWFRPKRALAIAAFAAAGFVLGAAVSFLFRDTFTSTARILISPPVVPLEPYDSSAAARDFHETEKRVFSDAQLRWVAQIALQGSGRQIFAMTEDALVAQLKSGAVRVHLDSPTEFSIECSAHDRKRAKIMSDRILMAFEETHARMEHEKARESELAMRINENNDGLKYEAIDLANLPATPSSPPRLYIGLAGLVLGLMAGALILRRRSLPVNARQDSLGTV